MIILSVRRNQLELEHLFARSWHLAGPECKVAKPGDYFVCQAENVPIVVTRDLEGQLSAFVNVCRHRFHAVALGEGNRKTLTCGYHGWTYTLDGKLHAVPGSERGCKFDKQGIALQPVAIDTWHGLFKEDEDVTNRVGEGLRAGIEQGYLLSESDKLVLDHQRLYRQIMGKHLGDLEYSTT